MKNLEEAVAENAKGILASTMKEEIKELVKESLTEQDDEIDVDAEMEEPEMMEPEMGDDEEGMEMDADNIDDMGDDEDTIDLTGEEDDDEILRVFSLMGPEDNIVVTKDDAGNINLKDSEKEYMIVGEGEEEDAEFDFGMEDELGEEWNESDELDMMEEDENIDDIVSKVFANDDESEDEEEFEFEDEFELEEDDDMGVEDDTVIYEIEFDSEEDSEEELDEMWGGNKHDFKRRGGHYKDYEDDEDELEDEYDEELDDVMESKMTVKPKGVGMGSPKKKIYSNKPNMEGGFKTVKKTVNKTMGTGKAKFEYKEGENLEGEFKPVKKVDAKEASRTYASG